MTENESDINENIKSLLQSVHDEQGGSPDKIEDVKALELAKIIVMELLNSDNIKSLSLLNQDQIEDITNAYLLNEYYRIDDIDMYINNYLTLKRSTNGFLVDKITNLCINNQEMQPQENQGFLSRVFRR